MAKNTATVYELMVAAQNNDSKAMLTLIKKFRPILMKYSRAVYDLIKKFRPSN